MENTTLYRERTLQNKIERPKIYKNKVLQSYLSNRWHLHKRKLLYYIAAKEILCFVNTEICTRIYNYREAALIKSKVK